MKAGSNIPNQLLWCHLSDTITITTIQNVLKKEGLKNQGLHLSALFIHAFCLVTAQIDEVRIFNREQKKM